MLKLLSKSPCQGLPGRVVLDFPLSRVARNACRAFAGLSSVQETFEVALRCFCKFLVAVLISR